MPLVRWEVLVFSSNCFFGVCMVHGLDICFPFSVLVVLDGHISTLVRKGFEAIVAG